MTDAELKAARDLADAASPGPWEVGERCDNAEPTEACSVVMSTPRTSPTGHSWKPAIFKDESHDECHHVVSLADALFIAAARSLVPELLDRIVELQDGLDESLQRWSDYARFTVNRTPGSDVKAYADLQRIGELRGRRIGRP